MGTVHISAEEFLRRIGDVIRSIRIRNGVDQKYMAARLGITQPALSKYERGKTDIPVLKLKEISDRYNVTMTDFFENKEPPSMIFRRLVKNPKVELSREYDEEFDRYMMSEGNKDKMDVLRAVDILVKQDLLDEDCRDKTVEFIISPNRMDSDMQRKRLNEYCKRLINHND